MKKVKIALASLLTMTFAIMPINAATNEGKIDTIDPVKLGDLSNTTVSNIYSSNVGYKVSNSFVCYSCGIYTKTTGSKTTVSGANILAPGIGVYFKNNNTWETGSFPGAYETGKGSYPLSSFFVAGYIGESNAFNVSNYKKAENVINNLLLSPDSSNASLSKEFSSDNVTISVKPELMENKNFVKLNYKVINNNSSETKTVNIATFNDIYIGGVPTAICNDNAAYKLNNTLPTITTGFNALTTNKYMTVILDETSGLLNNGGGTFKYWAGNRELADMDDSGNVTASSIITNLFNEGGIPAEAKKYGDSEFAYSWYKEVPANSTVEFSTLIGLGNLEDVYVTIDKLSPNYNKDKKEFDITTDDKNINIEGTINDKCGMGTYSYKINGVCVDDPEKTEGCKEYTYYTNNSFTTSYNAEIPTELLTDSENGNTFTVTANSVACGTDIEETKFTLNKDREPVGKYGINSNYIVLGIILIGGIGLFIYSRKQNKFPQV